jgi:bla regulator protein BlaR1
MQLLFLQQWFSGEALKAIGWTLIHSLWQGLLAAVIAGVVIITTKRSVARLRYNLLGAVLILFIITTVITFTQQFKDAVAEGKAFAGSNIQVTETSFTAINYEATSPAALTTLDRFVTYFNTNADLFVLIWAIFFFVHCIKLMAGLAGVQRIRNYKTHLSPGEWSEKLDHLSRLIGIKRSVSLFQSQLVKVPVAIGFFKPVILVPLGLLSNLPPEQVETILLHELAHIRRKDYLVNILQRFSEAAFFFNPALLWISSLVRQEREACCDDIVVANTSSKGNYLEALVSFQEYSLASQGYAMAISSKRHYLLNRVRRMITRENKKLNSMEKVLLMAGLLAITAFTFIPKQEANNKKKESSTVSASVKQITETKPATFTTLSKPAPALKRVSKQQNKKPVLDVPVVSPLKDTVPEAKGKEKKDVDAIDLRSVSSHVNDDGKTKTEKYTVTDQEGKEYTYTKLNNKLTSLSIGGKIIPENEFSNYSQLLDKIDAAVQEHRARRLKEMELRKAERAVRTEEMKDRLVEKKLLREYQDVQKKHLSALNRQTQLLDKSRKITENKRKEMIKLLEKLKEQKNVPMLNGREIIKNENHVDNSVNANIAANANINSTAKVSRNIKDIKQASDIHQPEIHLKNSSEVGLKFETNVDFATNLIKNPGYKPGIKEPRAFQYKPKAPAERGLPVKTTADIKPSGKTTPAKPEVNSGPLFKKPAPLFKKRVTT